MANFILSYDLNGSTPTHAQMDAHLAKLDAARGRILETVWYVGAWMALSDLYSYVNSVLSSNDRLFVTEAKEASFRNLLVSDQSLKDAWNKYRQ